MPLRTENTGLLKDPDVVLCSTPAAAEVVAHWQGWLTQHRKDWTEWHELTQRVASETWNVVRHSYTEQRYLVSTPNQDGRALVWRIPRKIDGTKKREDKATSAALTQIPWLLPLRGLKWTDTVMMAGGLAERFNRKPFTSKSKEEELGSAFMAAAKVKFPSKPLYVFQDTVNGTGLLTDDRQVFGFDPDANAFLAFGELEAFVRYCLAYILKGKDWSTDLDNESALRPFGLHPVSLY